MKTFTLEVTVNNNISFRDIERQLNKLDAETKIIEVESEE